MDIEILLKIVAGATAFIGFLFALRKFYQWLRPISIMPSVHYPKDGAKRGAIGAELVNKSNEVQYITECYAVGTYPLKSIILNHIKHPFIKPRLYKTMRFGTIIFPFIENKSIKLQPYEPLSLEQIVTEHPLAYFDASLFTIVVKLSTGRKIQSPKLEVPNMWYIFEQPTSYEKQNCIQRVASPFTVPKGSVPFYR